MPDISAEIAAFRDAAYGEEVRGSMISLANKLNGNILSELDTMEQTWNGYKNSVDSDLGNFEQAWKDYKDSVDSDMAELVDIVKPELIRMLTKEYYNFDSSEFIEYDIEFNGMYINTDGRIAAYDPLCVSEPIPVNNGDIVDAFMPANRAIAVISYTSDVTNNSGKTSLYTYQPICIGTGDGYNARPQHYYAYCNHDGHIVISGYGPNYSEEYNKILVRKINSSIIDEMVTELRACRLTNKIVENSFQENSDNEINLFNKNSIQDGYLVSLRNSQYDGIIKVDNWKCSSYIEVEPNSFYYLIRNKHYNVTSISNVQYVVVLDENLKEVGYIKKDIDQSTGGRLCKLPIHIYDNLQIYTPPTAKYVVFNIANPDFSYDLDEIIFSKVLKDNDNDFYKLKDYALPINLSKLSNNMTVNDSINLFDSEKIFDNIYIDGNTGYIVPFSTRNEKRLAVSEFIDVKPNTIYYVDRPGLGYKGAVFILNDGSYAYPINPSTDEEYETMYAIQNPCYLKSPDNAKYLIIEVMFADLGNPESTIVAESQSPVSWSPHDDNPRISYDNLPIDIANKNSTKITLSNSDKIGFFSNSYLNGYTIRTHHAIDNMSMYSDYIMYNYAKSGDDVLESLVRMNNDETWLGNVNLLNQNLTYGILAMMANDGALYNASPETYYQNCKKLCEYLRSMGVIPILSTEHRKTAFYYGLMRLAETEHYEFVDWGTEAQAYGIFSPFWYNAHPATRSAWLWSNGLKPALDALPRPRQSIKLFRKRPNTPSNLNDLMYNDIYERAERFVEIYNGSSCLTKTTEKYFDRIDTGNTRYEDVFSEYQKLQKKSETVYFGNYALVEGILPYTSQNLISLKCDIEASNIQHVYIKKNIRLNNGFSANRYIAFGITSGASLLSPNDTFTVTGGVFNDNILGTYTVSQVMNDSLVITTTSSSGKTTSGTDNPTTNISGLVLKGSYDYPNADYMSRFDKPLGEWVEITYSEQMDLKNYISTCIDYDKVSLLFLGNNIGIDDISFSCSGTKQKELYLTKTNPTYKKGTSILESTLLDDNTNWSNINSVPKYIPVSSTVNSSVTEPYPSGITTIRVLNSGDTLSQNLIRTNLNNVYHPEKIQLRIIARYFPTYIDSDSKWENSEITEGSYDVSLLSASIDNQTKFAQFHVGAFWHEYIAEILYNGGTKLVLSCDSKSVQIARVEFDIID